MSWITPKRANEALERVAAAFELLRKAIENFKANPPPYIPPRQRGVSWRCWNRRKWNRRRK